MTNIYDDADMLSENAHEPPPPNWPALFGSGHFTINITAMRKSGKSTLVNSLVGYYLISREYNTETKRIVKAPRHAQFFKKTILCSRTAGLDKSLDTKYFDEVYNTKEDINNIINRIEYLGPANVNTLLVLDDLIGMIDHSCASKINAFASVNRHYNTSLILATQAFKSVCPTIRVNCSMWIFFAVLNDDEYHKICKEIPGFATYYPMVDWSQPYNFLFIKICAGPSLEFYERFKKFLGVVKGQRVGKLKNVI